MKPYTHILFDLDGTITDPAEGITTCVRHALHCQGIEEDNYQNLCRMIGPPLAEGFRDFYGMNEEQAWQGIRDFRELFARIGVEKNIPYPGIRESPAAAQRGRQGAVRCHQQAGALCPVHCRALWPDRLL